FPPPDESLTSSSSHLTIKQVASLEASAPTAHRRWSMRRPSSLADAKLAKDRIQQILRRGLADDFTDGVHGDVQIQRDQFQGGILPQRGEGALRRLPRPA